MREQLSLPSLINIVWMYMSFKLQEAKYIVDLFAAVFIFPVLSSKSHYSPFEYIFLKVSFNILFIYPHKTCIF